MVGSPDGATGPRPRFLVSLRALLHIFVRGDLRSWLVARSGDRAYSAFTRVVASHPTRSSPSSPPRSPRLDAAREAFSSSSLQRGWGARTEPVLPLSARNMPYFFIAFRITCTFGGKPVTSKSALQPHAHAHRRQVRVGVAAGEVPRRVRRTPRRVRGHGEPQRVPDRLPLHHLVVAHQAGEDRQPGRVGGGPARRPQRVANSGRRPRRARLSSRRRSGMRVVQLVQLPVVAVDDTARAGRRRRLGPPSIGRVRRDRDRGRDRSRRRSRSVTGTLRLGAGDDHVRDAVRRAVPDGAEVADAAAVPARSWRSAPRSSGRPARRRRPGSTGCRRGRGAAAQAGVDAQLHRVDIELFRLRLRSDAPRRPWFLSPPR